MNRILPPLYEGHAPINLHLAFEDALEAYELWDVDSGEPSVDLEERQVAISAVFGRMRTCTDLLPARVLDSVRAVAGKGVADEAATYAEAAMVLRALCVARLRPAA